jgi:uncharacterized protein (DUF1800 family)
MALGQPEASRRALVASAAAVAGTGVALVAAPAQARGKKKPQKYQGQPLLKGRDRHLVSRFSYGVTPALASQVRAAGGARAWWERQLTPTAVPDAWADQLPTWWPSLSQSPQDMWAADKMGMMRAFGVCQDYQRYVLLRRIYSNRQVLELMTEFWENHLNIPLNGEPSYLFRRSYGETIRSNAFGRYEDILFSAITHPAMLVYLDNANSTAEHPNENLGRELLELHTVGLGTYTEDDVKESARILTGWRVDTQQGNRTPTWNASYIPGDHSLGPVRVMAFTDPNGDADGRDLTRRYVSYLAHHPMTARRIATKLVLKFVRDDASSALVERLAQVYLANDTAIVPVLRALVASPEFARAAGTKVRDATEEVVAVWRTLGAQVRRPTGPASAANTILWQTDSLGLMPFMWPRPDGAPLVNDPWCTPSRMIASFDLHHSMAGGWWPNASQGVVYRSLKSWVPQKTLRLDELVDHLSQQLLHQHATPVLVKAACTAVGYDADEAIDRRHPVRLYGISTLLTTILDSPEFFQR